MSAKLTWLLVGAGDISRKRVAGALSAARNSEIIAICEPWADSLNSLADEYAVTERYTDLDEALRSSSADAVYIATPVWLHAEQAVKALESGKHVLVEKPLGLTGKDSLRVVRCAKERGKYASCAYYRRFFPRYLHTKKMLEDGTFGQVVHVRMTYFSWSNFTKDDPKYWRVVRERSGGGPISDMGSHMFDVLIGLFGMPETVYAKCDNLVHKWDVEDSASILMKLRNGAHVLASFNWNSKTWRHEFEIVGTEAKIDWLPYDSGPVTETIGRDIRQLDLPNAENVHLPMVEDFVQSVLQGKAPQASLEEAAWTNVLIDAVYQSADEGREVAVHIPSTDTGSCGEVRSAGRKPS